MRIEKNLQTQSIWQLYDVESQKTISITNGNPIGQERQHPVGVFLKPGNLIYKSDFRNFFFEVENKT